MTAPIDLLPGVPPIESPLFAQILPDMDLSNDEEAIARSLNEKGFAVIEFPDPEILDRIERIKRSLVPHFGIDFGDHDAIARAGNPRIQDAWHDNDDVRAIAANPKIIDLLSRLYRRQAVPFQTLNFPVGTEQHPHSDSAHFSSLPERFMCGVWLAFEDIHPDSGPLVYYPGSHKWPIVTNAMVGQLGWQTNSDNAQAYAEPTWRAMIDAHGAQKQSFTPRCGQALIWAANLLHGGMARGNNQLTRWSQVTHYYFRDCVYYTPAFSDECLGRFDIRSITDITTGEPVQNRFLGEAVTRQAQPAASSKARRWLQRLRKKDAPAGRLPADFDPQVYYRLHPDVAEAGADAGQHYLDHGMAEGRRYKEG
ncbi:MAG: hypothetical protein NVS3B5_04590 [Sphingomicrobium sp.]